jgi:hypothetical protein
MCGSFRRTSRALTQLYDQALRPLSLSPTQLTILQLLSRAGEVSQGHLGEMLAMDSTSLTRTLPLWEKVQSRLRREIGEQAWNNVLRLTLQVTDAITTKGESL